MEQNNVKMGEIETYPCSTAMQHALDQESESSTSKSQLQDAWVDG